MIILEKCCYGAANAPLAEDEACALRKSGAAAIKGEGVIREEVVATAVGNAVASAAITGMSQAAVEATAGTPWTEMAAAAGATAPVDNMGVRMIAEVCRTSAVVPRVAVRMAGWFRYLDFQLPSPGVFFHLRAPLLPPPTVGVHIVVEMRILD